MQERRVELVRRELLDRVSARVADRIRSVCTHLSEQEFHDLVTRIAEIEIKYSTRRTADLFDVARQSAPSLASVTSRASATPLTPPTSPAEQASMGPGAPQPPETRAEESRSQ
jgi:hypothetical protein